VTTHLYHLPRSRSTRVLWTLEELGEPYELSIMTREESRGAEHRTRHPLGRVPAITDDGAHLFESAAIVLALADRDPQGRLSFPLGSRERELVYQWAFFAMLELEAPTVTARDEKERNPELHGAARERVREAAGVVERALEGRDFIVGDHFSAADIVLGSVLIFARDQGLLEDGFPEASRYADAIIARPARAKAYSVA
jgi:glutathione S-transferase